MLFALPLLAMLACSESDTGDATVSTHMVLLQEVYCSTQQMAEGPVTVPLEPDGVPMVIRCAPYADDDPRLYCYNGASYYLTEDGDLQIECTDGGASYQVWLLTPPA